MIHEVSSRTDQRREARGEVILDTAMALLGREGVEALTLQRVAREHGLVTAALYRYFPSKDALLAALQRRTVAALHERLQAYVADLASAHARRDARVRALIPIVGLAGFYTSASREMPEAFRLVMTLLGDPALLLSQEDAVRTAPLLAALLGDVGALFAAAETEGALPAGDVSQRTLIVWAALQGTMSLAKMARFDPRMGDVDSLGSEALRSLLRGWGADPEVVERASRALHARKVSR